MKIGRNDIVGRKVLHVYRTPWENMDGFDVCSLFVTLDNYITFEIISEDTDNSRLLDTCSIGTDWVSVDDEVECCGDEIVEVVGSTRWPSIGLLFRSDRALFLGAEFPTPIVGPRVILIGGTYGRDDIFPYWK